MSEPDADPTAAWSFETKQVHAGAAPDPTTGARATPIYQTTSYAFRDTEHAADLFGLAELGNIYTRIMNPTQDVLEQRVAALEGGVAAVAFASGQAAADPRDPQHRRGRRPLRLQRLALRRHLQPVPLHAAEAGHRGHVRRRPRRRSTRGAPRSARTPSCSTPRRWATRAATCSTCGAVADVAHEAGVPLIVDNTVPTPYLLRPIEHGADIVVHSATKFLGGHGTAIGGVVVDSGNFDWGDARRAVPRPHHAGPELPRPDLLGRARPARLHDQAAGAAAARPRPGDLPAERFLLIQGIETLSLRIERHVQNAQALAEWLEARDEVEKVHYAGLPSSPWYELRQQYLPRGAGAVVAFDLRRRRGGGQAVRRRAGAAQPPRQHRRRAQPGDPPGQHHAQPALRRGAARHRRHARAWCGCRSGSRASRTSRPTSTPGSGPPRAPEP